MFIKPYINLKNNKIDKFKVIIVCEFCNQHERIVSKKFLTNIKEKTKEDYKYRCWTCSQKQRILPHAPIGHIYHIKQCYDRIRTENGRQHVHRYVVEQNLNRKLTSKEQVHHIDFDKYNNNLDNLFLCASNSEHIKLANSLEKLGYCFLNKLIWFNKEKKKYVLDKIKNIIYEEPEIIFPETNRITIRNRRKNKNGTNAGTYPIYIKERQRFPYWKLVMECFLKRSLIKKEENIHHIDGDEYNNSINNLCIVTNKEHHYAHYSLRLCAIELYKQGVIVFKDGKYMIQEATTEIKVRGEKPCKKYEFDCCLPKETFSICLDCGYALMYHKYKIPNKKRKKYKKHALRSLEDQILHICYCKNCNCRCKRSNPSLKRPCPKCGNRDFKII
jgi:HNH endonuclease